MPSMFGDWSDNYPIRDKQDKKIADNREEWKKLSSDEKMKLKKKIKFNGYITPRYDDTDDVIAKCLSVR